MQQTEKLRLGCDARGESPRHVVNALVEDRLDFRDLRAHPPDLAVDVDHRALIECAAHARGRDERGDLDERECDQKNCSRANDAVRRRPHTASLFAR